MKISVKPRHGARHGGCGVGDALMWVPKFQKRPWVEMESFFFLPRSGFEAIPITSSICPSELTA
jgi:hypothetical protein